MNYHEAFFISSGNAKYYLARNNFTPHIHHGFAHSFSFEPCLPDHPKYQLRVEPFPGPRGHSLVIEVSSDLAGIHPILLKPQNAVDQGLVVRIKVNKGQCFGLHPNSNTKVYGGLDFDPKKGQKEIIPPSPTSPSS